ncbi:MAG: hypothetical protein ACE5HK_04405 [Candidatus Methylomirabilales bacterium]
MALATALVGATLAEEGQGKSVPPSAVVRAYLTALTEGDFLKTYDYVSDRLRQGLSRDQWARRLERNAVKARTKVLSMRINPAIMRGGEATVVASFRLETEGRHRVSRETYTLVQGAGGWRIDEIKVFVAPGR